MVGLVVVFAILMDKESILVVMRWADMTFAGTIIVINSCGSIHKTVVAVVTEIISTRTVVVVQKATAKGTRA